MNEKIHHPQHKPLMLRRAQHGRFVLLKTVRRNNQRALRRIGIRAESFIFILASWVVGFVVLSLMSRVGWVNSFTVNPTHRSHRCWVAKSMQPNLRYWAVELNTAQCPLVIAPYGLKWWLVKAFKIDNHPASL